MGKKTITKWVWALDENDKNQIKQYSEKISKIFKLNGYNPSTHHMFVYFDDLSRFFGFIPCISEGYSECEDEDFDAFCEKAEEALDAAYDDKVKVTIEDVENYAKETGDNIYKVVYDRISDAGIESEVADWVLDNCDPITKQKFLDWVYSD